MLKMTIMTATDSIPDMLKLAILTMSVHGNLKKNLTNL
jgi:hypothetical protein